jgi:hypothetical protein
MDKKKLAKKIKKAQIIPQIAVIALFAILVCLIGFYLGADINWDLQNYHFYNGYLYVHGKLITDSLATIQSYLDPLLNSFYYLLISNLTPLQVNMIIAVLQSLSLSMVFFLSMLIFEENSYVYKFILSVIIAVSAIFGPIFYSEIGGTMGDTLLAFPVIISIIFIVKIITKASNLKQQMKYVAVSGIMIGFVSGLKFTNMTYAVGMFVSLAIILLIMKLKYKEQLLIMLIFASTAALSFFAIYAPIGLLLYKHFQNPIFPYFNNIFKSPYLLPYAIHDGRWFPKHFIGYLKIPFEFCFRYNYNSRHHNLMRMELPFRTYLFAGIFILLPFYIINYLKFAKFKYRERYAGLFIVLFFTISFIVWEKMFSYYRYISVLEIIAPFTIVIMLVSFFKNGFKKSKIPLIIAVLVLVVSLLSLPDNNWGREPFTNSYFGINKKIFKKYGNSLIVAGHAPIGFVLPYFPNNVKVMGLPERIGGLTELFQKSYLRKLVNFKGNIYYLSQYNKSLSIVKEHTKFLKLKYNLKIEYNKCKEINTNIYPVAICKMIKIGESYE